MLRYYRKIIEEYFYSSESSISEFIKVEFEKSSYKDLTSFLEEYLYEYGVNTINIHGPCSMKNKFKPYVAFDERNIFKETEGIKYLRKNLLGDQSAQKVMANYLISKISFIHPKTFLNWRK